MKKRYAGLLIAALLMAQPLTAYAAGSVSSRPSGGSGGGGGGGSNRSASMRSGQLNQGDAPVVNNGSNVPFITDTNALLEAGFSWDLIEKINTINAGTEALYRTIGTNNLVGYVPLAPVQTALLGDGASLELYVPNLVEGLNDIQILFYNQSTKTWDLKAPDRIDYAAKEISVNLSGTTPFTIVYKK